MAVSGVLCGPWMWQPARPISAREVYAMRACSAQRCVELMFLLGVYNTTFLASVVLWGNSDCCNVLLSLFLQSPEEVLDSFEDAFCVLGGVLCASGRILGGLFGRSATTFDQFALRSSILESP